MSNLQERIENLPPEKRALLLRRLRQKQADEAKQSQIGRRDDLGAYPLSYAQQRLWFLSQIEPDSPFYNIPGALRLHGSLNVEALTHALNEIVQRHEVMRARMRTENGAPLQDILDEQTLDLPVMDLRASSGAVQQKQVETLARKEGAWIFDLQRGPLIRACLLRLAEEEFVLLVTLHHIIADGWSMGVLVTELQALYDAQIQGKTRLLPELAIQYADYAAWQRNWLDGGGADEQLAFWRQKLADAPPLLELPLDHPRPAILSHRGRHVDFALSAALSMRLKALCKEQNTTLFMVLMAGFLALLYRYTAQEDISIGTPVANRNRVETEGLIGFFVNTLILRSQVSGEESFLDLLVDVRRTALEAFDYQDVPFEMLVDQLAPERNMSYSPLFQVMFDVQTSAVEKLNMRGLQAELLELETGTAKFDLLLQFVDEKDGITGLFEFNTDLFDTSTIHCMVDHLVRLLQGAVTDPNQAVCELPLMSESEIDQLLVGWNDTAAETPVEKCIHILFEEQVQRTPDAPALVFKGSEWTYAELNRAANRLAHTLQDCGVGPEKMVGLYLERSMKLVTAMLAVLKAGGAYVPIDPIYPKERVSYILEDAQIAVLLTESDLAAEQTSFDVQVIDLDDDFAAKPDDNPISDVAPHNLAYVIYTSGSTGMPKGVLLEHKGVSNLVMSFIQNVDMGSATRALNFFSYTFDGSVFDIFTALLSGAALFLPPRGATIPGQPLVSLMREECISNILLTPSALNVLPQEALPALDFMMTGGEACTWDLVKRWGQDHQYVNVYGPTEITVISNFTFLDGDERLDRNVPIGRALQNTQSYVLDSAFQPVPIGVKGELFIGGIGVARGYLNRPELTAQRFVTIDLNGKPERVYRTGDVVRWMPDGRLEFLGRVDHQVKVRGFRIELGEIETAICRHPAVQEAVVTVHEGGSGDRRLCAYVVCGAEVDEGVSSTSLRAYLKEQLPNYMLPSMITMLDALPLTTTGKVDRKKLPEPVFSRLDMENQYVAPQTEQEIFLAEMWREVLEMDKIGVHDNFFELGGDSIQAAVVMNRVQEAIGTAIPVRAIFMNPTIAALAEEIERNTQVDMGETGAEENSFNIPIIPREGELPLSFAQQRLWFLDQLEPDSPFYNIAGAYRIEGVLNEAWLQESIDAMVQRHEVLRTGFMSVSGKAVLEILPQAAVELQVVDMGTEEAVFEQAIAEARKPFRLNEIPLMRATLLRISPQDHLFVFVIHHIIADGWSGGVLVREIAEGYAELAASGEMNKPELDVQYVDYAAWQRDTLQGTVMEELLAYWKEALANIPPLLELPWDHPRPPVQTFKGQIEHFEIPAGLFSRLQQLSQECGTTVFMSLTAAFQVLLHRYSGMTDICVGTPIANRNHAALEKLAGFFANTLILRAKFEGEMSFRDLLDQVKAFSLGAYAHQELPFDMLVDALQPQRNLGYAPLFQAMIAYQNTPAETLHLPNVEMKPVALDVGMSKFDLTLLLTEEGDELLGDIEYSTELFDAETIQRMVAHFIILLQSIVDDPQSQVSDLKLLTDYEREKLLVAWNETGLPYRRETCFHLAFEEQAAHTQDVPAVIANGITLSYRELNQRANQLARILRRQGVGPETLVCVYFERSVEQVVSVLAIHKAGGAYVPMDTNYPPDRLTHMLRDSRAPVLLTVEDMLGDLDFSGVKDICLDRDAAQIAAEADSNLQLTVSARQLAYVIYTSGSTGKPKGVMIQHDTVMNLAAALHDRIYAKACKDHLRVSVNAPICFDPSMQQMVQLLYGHSLYIIPQDVRQDGAGLLQFIQENRLDVVDCVPSQLKLLIDAGLLETSGWVPEIMLPGGEAISEAIWQKIRSSERIAFYNMYGPTECTVDSTIGWVQEAPTQVHIGRPVANARSYILDQQGNPVPIGVAGELYIGGAGVGRGYWQKPEMTAQRFVADPFVIGGRMYRTGDLVRYLPDGNIDFLGRVDHQVKVRGYRIELGEVESVLRRQDELEDAVVIVREDEPDDKRLVAYCIPTGEVPPTISYLMRIANKHLPDYMVPSHFVFLPEFPLTPNGKVDRLALPQPDSERPELDNQYQAPQTEVEVILAQVWEDVLGVEGIGVHDNFFELGGDSILSIQVIARAKEQGVDLTTRQFFQEPTIAGQAEVAGQAQVVEAEQGLVIGQVPLTPIQHLFFETQKVEVDHWNQAMLFELRKPIEMDVLREAVRQVMLHHDALRMQFTDEPEGWQQVCLEEVNEFSVAYFDLSQTAEPYLSESIERAAAGLQASLDLAAGKVFRAVIIDCGVECPDRLLLVAHHLVVDSVSWRILLEDLLRVVEQIEQGKPASLPNKTTSYRAWAQHLAALAQKEALPGLDLWHQSALENIVPLPVDWVNGSNLEADEHELTVMLDEEATHSLLQEVPQVYGTEINDVLLTALARAYRCWTGAASLWVDMEGHGRQSTFEEVDLTRTVGWFTAIYPVALDLNGLPNIGEELKQVKETLRRYSPHGYQYGLLRYLAPQSEDVQQLQEMPQPEISFNYLGQFDQALQMTERIALAKESSGAERSPKAKRPNLLSINGGVINGCLKLDWAYSAAIHRSETIEFVANAYLEELRAVLAHCQDPTAGGYTPSDFPDMALDQDELDALLEELG
jgi:amino acid adenylation domain-containing protein/non-ribosomal peptide synthase protein (TIGR01720 family)